jgi:NAD(P)-dependent dehydrogenase (short-subunit alcohol dehydrogenase family)
MLDLSIHLVRTAQRGYGGNKELMKGRLGDLPQETFMPFVQANLFSMLYLVQAALPHLRKNEALSRVVVVSSGASTGAYAAWGLYSMAKAAQNSMVRTLALEEKGNAVSFYAVRPGVIDVSARYAIK